MANAAASYVAANCTITGGDDVIDGGGSNDIIYGDYSNGGLIVGVTVNLAGAYLPFVGGDLQLAVALAIIIGVLVLKPNGLLGRPTVRRV